MNKIVLFFELGYVFNLLGLTILIIHIRWKRHIEGISFYTQLLFTISTFVKVFYFPFTILTDYWFCWFEFVASIVLSGFLMYQLKTYKRLSFSKESNFFDWRILVVIAIILGLVSNYEKKDVFSFSQYAIRVSIILESIGLLPQIRLMKQEKFVPKYFGYYLLTMFASRLTRIMFWYYQLIDAYSNDRYYTLIIADIFYIVLTSDFCYNFIVHRKSSLIPYS